MGAKLTTSFTNLARTYLRSAKLITATTKSRVWRTNEIVDAICSIYTFELEEAIEVFKQTPVRKTKYLPYLLKLKKDIENGTYTPQQYAR